MTNQELNAILINVIKEKEKPYTNFYAAKTKTIFQKAYSIFRPHFLKKGLPNLLKPLQSQI